MKKLYELVVVFDPDASNDTVKTTRAKVEKRVDIQQTDDMGILPLAYSLK
jgi:ribosomal protein S6